MKGDLDTQDHSTQLTEKLRRHLEPVPTSGSSSHQLLFPGPISHQPPNSPGLCLHLLQAAWYQGLQHNASQLPMSNLSSSLPHLFPLVLLLLSFETGSPG